MTYFFIFEVILLVISIFSARKMVKNRSVFAKGIAIGKDDDETIEKMKRIAKEIILTGKFEISEWLEGYNIKLKVDSGVIKNITIDTNKTKIIYDCQGMKVNVFNNAFSERGATVYLAIGIWTYLSILLFIIGYIIFILLLP